MSVGLLTRMRTSAFISYCDITSYHKHSSLEYTHLLYDSFMAQESICRLAGALGQGYTS